MPLSVPTPQTRSVAARAVADVPGPSATAAARHTNAQATARELIIIFVNFVFIVVVFFCLSFSRFGLSDSSLSSCHFRPFTEVLRKNFESLTREVGFTALKNVDPSKR
jgi:hypothetical protein